MVSKRLVVGIVAVIIAVSLVAVIVLQKLVVNPPGVPQSPSVTGDIWQTTIQWSEVTDATSYIIYWSTTPGFTKTSGTKIEVLNTSYVHENLENNATYYYLITAVGPGGESDVSTEISATTRLPRITGNAIFPDLSISYENNLPGGGLYGVYLYDLSWNELANDTDTNPSYSFSVELNKAYILVAYYNGGQAIAAVTPTITDDMVQNISIDTEVAMSLIVATEQPSGNLESTSLSRPLDDLLEDANQEVIRLNAFYQDRNNNRTADRIADAVHALTLDKLSQGSGVSFAELNEATIRAYGGGLQGIRSLSDMLSNPKPPLNPHFTFTRYNSNEEVDFGMSDLDTKRWDYIGYGWFPHITPGGTAVVYVGPTSSLMNETRPVRGVYKKVLGSTVDPILLTPLNIDCLSASWSPDETKVAFSGRYFDPGPASKDFSYEPYNIFIMNSDGSDPTQLTNYAGPLIYTEIREEQGAMNPSWSPDGSEIIFQTLCITENPDMTVSIVNSLEKINANGTNQRTFLDGVSTGFRGPVWPSWSPDGSKILFCARPPGQDDYEIIVVSSDLEQDDTAHILTGNTAEDYWPAWSYDGRFIIFSSNREGEVGTLPGQRYLDPFYVINSYTKEVVADLGDFTNAGYYFGPRFTATEAVFSTIEGVDTDEYGNAVIDTGSDKRYNNDHSSYNYYREIIPVANTMGITFACTSWFG
jgi:hypothetical protein